jgi:protein arginine kinase activator
MLCQICGKNTASVHFTEIQDNKMTELNLCEECAEERGITPQVGKNKFAIAEVLASMVDTMSSSEEQRVGHVQCPRCGLLYSAFKETGRLGCSDCYAAFQYQLRPLLRRIHGSTRHSGKIPNRQGPGLARARQMQRMHDELQQAIEGEEFERAAEIRDLIKKLEAEAAQGEGAEGRT